MHRILRAALIALVAAAPFAAHAQSAGPTAEQALLLVARPDFRDPQYRETVLLVTPTSEGRHVGVIINRPTERSLASLFPEHAPSQKVMDPVYFGGPFGNTAVVAVVKTPRNPGKGSIPFTKDLFLAVRVDVVDRIIETTPNDARYYVGYVGWRRGELRNELDRGLWYVMDAPEDVVFRKDTSGLWEELVRRARLLTVSAPPRGTILAVAR